MKNILLLLFIFIGVKGFTQAQVVKETIDSSSNIYYERVDTNYFERHGLFPFQTELPDGKWYILYNNSKIYAIFNLKDKKIIDTVFYYWPSGTVFIREVYKNGLLNSEKDNYHKNGKIGVKSFWDNGERVGVWKYYNEEGKLIKKIKSTDPRLGPK
ncbi:MAG TPA: hypothetical protein VK835_09970 [Bacteroidia bacterium]|jgi:antitoxin component YwqK of YwqJK toxin-antitoxin module|nr:hypothetical protein [Bacteroidia bacterium]